jgi:hypothetical protein
MKGQGVQSSVDYDKVMRGTKLLSHKKSRIDGPDFMRSCPRDNAIYHQTEELNNVLYDNFRQDVED